ncbi:MAG: type II secretion system F family protein [Candidatus Micrarchaeia archaeon]
MDEEEKEITVEERVEKKGAWESFLAYVAAQFPKLKKSMREARMTISATDFVGRQLTFAVFMSIFIGIIVALVMYLQGANWLIAIPIAIICYPLMFLVGMQYPSALVAKRRREIDKDVLFAGRHLWIALKGGMPLFDSMLAVSKGGYGEVSREMNRLVEKVLVGVPIDVAAAEVVEDCPSPAFRRILMQMVNSIRSGADVSDSLDVVLEQISKEQMINIKEYGQRLNPIVMFYMVIGVIVPSLGISVGLLILSFAGWSVGLKEMWAVIPIVAIIQYMFLSYAEITRPVYEV